MKILITGVNGFIANNLAKYFSDNKIEVYGTSSRDIDNSNCIKTFKLKIGDEFNIENIEFNWVIHCVYDKNLSVEMNTDSTISWAKEFKNRGVKNQIFISSISAISGNDSKYSKLKRETELWFLQRDMYIIRPGLVVGDGGLFKEMINKVKSFPVMPLVNGGVSDVKLIGLNDLMNEINNIVNIFPPNKEKNIFYPNKYMLKDLLKNIAKFYGQKIFFISIPFTILFNIVRLLEIFKINIGVTSQNIRGLVSNEVDVTCDIDYKKDILLVLKENLKD